MDKEFYTRIPKQKLSFYKKIKVDKEIRTLIKLVNYLEKWSQSYEKRGLSHHE